MKTTVKTTNAVVARHAQKNEKIMTLEMGVNDTHTHTHTHTRSWQRNKTHSNHEHAASLVLPLCNGGYSHTAFAPQLRSAAAKACSQSTSPPSVKATRTQRTHKESSPASPTLLPRTRKQTETHFTVGGVNTHTRSALAPVLSRTRTHRQRESSPWPGT